MCPYLIPHILCYKSLFLSPKFWFSLLVSSVVKLKSIALSNWQHQAQKSSSSHYWIFSFVPSSSSLRLRSLFFFLVWEIDGDNKSDGDHFRWCIWNVVAIKEIAMEIATSGIFISRKISHPNVIRFVDMIEVRLLLLFLTWLRMLLACTSFLDQLHHNRFGS